MFTSENLRTMSRLDERVKQSRAPVRGPGRVLGRLPAAEVGPQPRSARTAYLAFLQEGLDLAEQILFLVEPDISDLLRNDGIAPRPSAAA
jgi:hypothetical protein